MVRIHAFAALLVLAACSSEHPKGAAALLPSAQTHAVAAARFERTSGQEFVGTVRAKEHASLTPTIMGTLSELRVSLGQRVTAGQVLARVSASEIDARAAQARAMKARAKLDLDRSTKLLETSAIPRAQFDESQAQYNVADASLAEANAMIEHTLVRAPFAGVITGKPANVGDTAVPGQPILTLEDPSSLRLEASLPEGVARNLHAGMPLSVKVDGLGNLDGTVSEVSPTSDASSRTVLVKVDLPASPALHPGVFGRVAIASASSDAVGVPSRAVLTRGQLEEVFVIDGGTARLRLVKTGREQGGVVEVLSGLRDGELVAIDEAAQLLDQQPVQVVQ